jgi:hypothetical protein
MIGFVIGAVCLIGLVKVLRGGRRRGWGCGYHSHYDSCGDDGCGGGGGGWRQGWQGHHRGFGGPFGGPRGFRRGFEDDGPSGFDRGPGPVLLRGLFERLQATPGQEKVIAEALRDLRSAFKKSAEEKAKGAKQVAEALRGDEFKTENMGEAFSHLDSSTETVRDAMFSALAKIHDALDERQRKILADLVGKGGRALENLAEQA